MPAKALLYPELEEFPTQGREERALHAGYKVQFRLQGNSAAARPSIFKCSPL